MNGMHASNFRRIHIGLILDLILMFLMPAVLAILLILVINDLSSAFGTVENLTVTELLADPIPALKAVYIVLLLQYCLAALCALLIVSGLGELSSGFKELQRSKRWFILLMVAEGIAMLAHILDVLLQDDNPVSTTAALYFAALLLLLMFRAFALHSLLMGCADILDRLGASKQSGRAFRLSRRIVIAVVLLMALIAAAFVLSLLDLVKPARVYVLIFAVFIFVFYIVCRIQTVRCVGVVRNWIATLSE